MITGFYLRFGDLDFSSTPNRAVNAQVQALAQALLRSPLPGVTDLIPAYASLYLEFDSRRVGERRVRAWADGQLEHASPSTPQKAERTLELPTHYGGPDLGEVASRTGLSAAEVVRRHSSRTYHVYAVGFTPGLAFMGELEPALQLPRRAEPRPHVAAGSVAIAGAQTTVYPVASPGGWHLLGRVLTPVYDPRRSPPLRLGAGARVRFVPVQDAAPESEARPLELLPERPYEPFVRVCEAGLCDLLHDAGRFLAGRYGFARSGPLDPRSAAVANRLLGNPPGSTLLELNLRGGVYEALGAGVLAFAGYGLRPRLNGEEVPPFTSFLVGRGDRISFTPNTPARTSGSRGYLAVAGGVESRRFLGSASVDLKGGVGRPLRAGDVLGRAEWRKARPGRRFVPYAKPEKRTTLRLLPGPQASAEALGALTQGSFRVRSADRMGARLSGAAVPGGEGLSEAVPLGSVQIPPSGDPILLLADRGTIGGYAKPALIHPNDLWRAGQLTPGDVLRFRLG